jgi:hypothetical protein
MNLAFQTTASLSIYPTYETGDSRHPATSRQVTPFSPVIWWLSAPEMKDVLEQGTFSLI